MTHIFIILTIILSHIYTGLLEDSNDKSTKEKNLNIRAIPARELITKLGPTAIKIGQAISVRPDILNPAYIAELSKLQDKVPPFENQIAIDIIEKSLNTPISTLFEDSDVTFRINPPVAAASLGQVYKARLKKGAGTGAGIGSGEGQTGNDVPEYVAVKVQRPNMKLKVRLYASVCIT